MQPIAFTIGGLTVRWYGVMMAVAFVAGLLTASRRARRDNIPQERIIDLGPWLIVGSIIGARLVYVITFWRDQFANEPWWEVFMVQHGGLVYYGGFIGACAACILYAYLKQVPLWKLADIMAPSVALGYVFGRIGCLMNGCCYGRKCDLPWAIHFPAGHPTYPNPVHPTEVYESLLSLVLYGALAWLYRHKKFDGQVFAAYLVCYALCRSFVEIFRGDYPAYQRGFGGLATPAQMVSIGILTGGLALWWILSRQKLRPAK